MEVLLVNPPDIKSKYKDVLGLTAPPLGLAYIGAVLEERRQGHHFRCAGPRSGLAGLRRELARKHVDLLGVQTTTPTISKPSQWAKLPKSSTLSAPLQWGDITPPSCQSRSCVKTTLSMS